MRSLAIAAFTLAAFALLPKVALATTLQEALEACNTSGGTIFPSGSTVELLVAAGSELARAAQDRYKGLAVDAIIQACRAAATIEIRPIDGRSKEHPRAFAATAPSTADAQDNFNILQDKRAVFLAGALNALDDLYRHPGTPGADIEGAIEQAAAATANVKGPRIIAVISSGWQQTNPDTYRAGEDPAHFANRFISERRNAGALPNLDGNTFVFFAGANAGPQAMGESRFLSSLCNRFWNPVIRASHGSWNGCWPEFPSPLGLLLK